MTQTAQIMCINKSNRTDPHERITHVGGNTGKQWKITQQDAIRMIEAREWDFFVAAHGHRVKVIVALSRYGHKYIKTENDGDQPDNLLSLPECP